MNIPKLLDILLEVPLMNHNDSSCNIYLNRLCKSIYDSKQRSSIRQEVLDMIEDFTADYMSKGMDEHTAREVAVKQMGNPEETGEQFNQIYRVSFDWKIALYTILWFFIVHFMLIFFKWNNPEMAGAGMVPNHIYNIIGSVVIVLGFVVAIMEKRMDLPFFYAWGQNWKGSALSNSGLICGFGLGFLMLSTTYLVVYVVAVCTLLLILRAYIDSLRNKKEQAYLWEEGIAQEDFSFRGDVMLSNKKVLIQVSQGTTLHKGDPVIITGICGFVLVAEPLNPVIPEMDSKTVQTEQDCDAEQSNPKKPTLYVIPKQDRPAGYELCLKVNTITKWGFILCALGMLIFVAPIITSFYMYSDSTFGSYEQSLHAALLPGTFFVLPTIVIAGILCLVLLLMTSYIKKVMLKQYIANL